ncbi:hypothetical protein O6H91_22G059800 [Diphasiastrum complanatum]|uniref:Uncharacterized protein n=4 Tax=Diphasiastrum complanatum TaxID=34168 RepID=A0ACC2AG00_DIPCM|nr:hypothetical protein O6H91_22G059800 [Diphasiastrum complanatum]KAJ7516479.1 hypothetical protein O6H91_22G059800 [Diphasiastrum complanatum]KAJ7516482.1 hypothetical protein O6H91_22G059800 [Diphasiastrum complanatum]KAJ7516483.1 hypothetical protein O6H91_22G059800 [Diphasiastrum complanatum]
MPLVRYEIQNEYKLGSLELYRTAPKDDSESILEGVTMVGLVGILRQLGDLAEFAAELFHDLHEEVMATAARGHDLVARVLQLEAELPYIEKVLLSDTDPLRLFSLPGVDWHATIRSDQNHFTQGDLPRFVRSSYEECRGPPRLFLLDKFDVGGAEACLKRYTDPSFFKRQWASTELTKAEKAQRERKARRGKKKAIRRTNNGDIGDAAVARRMKPRRVRYSSLSSENLDYFLDSGTPQPTGNQFNSLSKPRDATSAVTEKYQRMMSFNTMNTSASKESLLPPIIPQANNLQLSKAKHPAEAVRVESERTAQRGKEVEEEVSFQRKTYGAPSKFNEEQTILNKEEQEDTREVSSPKDMAIESDRFEDAMATSETDSEALKQQLDDDDFNVQTRREEIDLVSAPNLQFDAFSKADYAQETGQKSVRTEQLPKRLTADGERFIEDSGILEGHTGNLKMSISGIPSEIDVYEDAVNAQSETDSEVSAKQIPDNGFAIADEQPDTKSISTIKPQVQEDSEIGISRQLDHDFVHLHRVSPVKSHSDEVGVETVTEKFGASKTDISIEDAREEHFNLENCNEANISKAITSPDRNGKQKLISAAGILAVQAESKSVWTADPQSNGCLESKSKEEIAPYAIDDRGVLPWKNSETLVYRGFAKDLDIPSEHVPALKEFTSNSSSELDGFEDAIGAEFDTGSELTSKQELDDISSLQDTTTETISTELPLVEFFEDDRLEATQKISEDCMQGDPEADDWRNDDTICSNLEPTNINQIRSAHSGQHPSDLTKYGECDKSDVLPELSLLDNSATPDDLCETKRKCVQATDPASKVNEVCDRDLSQLQSRPAQMMPSSNSGLPHVVVSDEQQIAATGKLQDIMDDVLAGEMSFGEGNKPEQPEGAPACEPTVDTDADLQQGSVADFMEHDGQTIVQKIGSSTADIYREGTKKEIPVEKFGLDNQPHMITFGEKSDHVLPLLDPLHVKNIPLNDMVGNINATVVGTVSALLDSSEPASVPIKHGSSDASHSRRASSENYPENLSVQDGLPDDGCSVPEGNVIDYNMETYNVIDDVPSVMDGSESQRVEPCDFSTAKPATHPDTLLGTDVERQSPKAEFQNKSSNQFLPFTPKSPPLSPISSFELPAALHELSERLQDVEGETSRPLQMDQTGRPVYRLMLDDTLDDSPAISPIVSPMWSSESPTVGDEPGEMFDMRNPSVFPSSHSPSPPSSPSSPTALKVQDDFLSDSDLKVYHVDTLSCGSSPRDAPHGTLASEGIGSGYIDKKDVSIFTSTSSPSLSARGSPISPTSCASQDENVSHTDGGLKAFEDLSDIPTSNDVKLSIPLLENPVSEPSPINPALDVLTTSVQPAPLSMQETPSREIGTSTVSTRSGSASPGSLKSPKCTSKDEVALNEAGESFPIISIPAFPEMGPTVPSSLNLEADLASAALSSLEGQTSNTYEEMSSSTQQPPAPLPPTPPRKPPKGFQGLSRALTTKASLGDQRHELVNAISVSSLSKLRKVSIQTPPKPRNVNDREVLLEQIRTRSFNLRHTTVEKREFPSRPVPNINVAAILEKANSMRHAVVGSDEDEDSDGWSDE